MSRPAQPSHLPAGGEVPRPRSGLPVPAGGLKAGRLGRLDRPARPHRERDTDGFVPAPPDTFGIRDEEIAELLTELDSRQVAVVVAGTGSGKSTFLPWRLLVPPEPLRGRPSDPARQNRRHPT
ncbi:hypothetical protein ACRAWF_25730 [Streptomyces sp. L7]